MAMNKLFLNIMATGLAVLFLDLVPQYGAIAQTADFSDFIIKSPAPIAGQVYSDGYRAQPYWDNYQEPDYFIEAPPQRYNGPAAEYYDEPPYFPW